MLPRVFVHHTGAQRHHEIQLGEADAHHFARVLRVKPAEQLVVVTPGGPWLAEIAEVSKDAVIARLLEQYPSSEPTAHIVMVQGVAKGDKMETIVQKCTEVGAHSFVLYQAERSVVKLDGKVENKLARWQKVAREAAMQSQRDAIPAVRYETRLSQLCEGLFADGIEQFIVLDEAERAVGLVHALAHFDASPGAPEGTSRPKRAIFIGPEGGWSDAERAYFEACEQAVLVTLGPRILRTETAGVAALAIALAHFGDMGG
ncbi:RsmE family RNA methyltransferase [Alicyclobacillus acidoterrestris]|uniref:Ribosomal RNA small subunit methyltransferase E n=1 Tax=Alicyclobacillus acidoterrestris (strain ATCC 49025 / DSM 3922 / CIP 106132 / NCIMB 13137 / GD3B) TaxID=1356854 RepID=T0CJB2_ALIAG|nr:16S rRNA (uracil(1498)-N(3))-methyltransferase [Alicyclobacillus acidoterrestris]EPZ52585.1 hypothetical protein N007_20295 [Alicyclobacillus acidoterrestris ATCC 49025]UNO47906.1 16S rRNA (uracil(1498)-N(3))-methyltransferase [Alicyclobacillus acidoterrestris]GEO26824.1 ribosomal RNA small subunit methyltransferase E [Alicyclobacillus acidoterrestris]